MFMVKPRLLVTCYDPQHFKVWAVEMLFGFGVLLLDVGVFWVRFNKSTLE